MHAFYCTTKSNSLSLSLYDKITFWSSFYRVNQAPDLYSLELNTVALEHCIDQTHAKISKLAFSILKSHCQRNLTWNPFRLPVGWTNIVDGGQKINYVCTWSFAVANFSRLAPENSWWPRSCCIVPPQTTCCLPQGVWCPLTRRCSSR